MVEDSPGYQRCRFCSSSFSDDLLNKIKDDKDDVYCENCGDIVKRVQKNYEFTSLKAAETEPNPNIETTKDYHLNKITKQKRGGNVTRLIGLVVVTLALLLVGVAVPTLAHSGDTDSGTYESAYIDRPTLTRVAEAL